MKLIAPDYYCDFACIKGACRHSCCVGWEIDIDSDMLAYYQTAGGSIGDRLRANIVRQEEYACFKLDQHNRCPFLNAEGLCDLIIELGEDSLCQICADHPRFRNFFSDREEIGLGLCCEAAARLILTHPTAVRPSILEDDGIEDALPEDEAEILRLRDDLIARIQDRQLPMEVRVGNMLRFAELDLPEIDLSHWRQFLLKLERLDESWATQLEILGAAAELHPLPADLETPYEQLMVYLLQRHINADDEDLSGRIAYCVLIWKLIRAMHNSGNPDGLLEICRLYSSEIEYSDENMEAIICELHRLYPEI